jgi:hypothetical protein
MKHDGYLNNAHLIISYNSSNDSFVGIVTNPTDRTLNNVRVEVHMYNGSDSKELGPTPAENLLPGESRTVDLYAEGWSFETWIVHPETGEGEHGEEDDHED